MEKKKVRLSGLQWLSVVIFGMCATTYGNMQYLVQYYYAMYQEANGLSNAQMGIILSAVGIAAVIAYSYSGFLTDIVKPKILMAITLSLAIVGGIILIFDPGYVASIIIFCGFALLPAWGPVSKLIVSISSEEQINAMFGLLDFFLAVFGLIAGFFAASVVASTGSASAVHALIMFNTVCNFIGLIAVFYIGKKAEKTLAASEDESGFSFRKVGILFRDPNQWMLWLGMALGYTGYIALTYVGPMLIDVFGMSTAAVTRVDAVKNSAIGLIAPLTAGVLATKLGAVRSYFLWLGLYLVSVIALIVTPWAPAFVAVAVLCIVFLAFSVKGRSAISNSVITNSKTPMALFGTSVCIQSVFMAIPDVFCYSIAGNWLDKYGYNGYYYIFGMCLAFCLAGLICNIVLDRRIKAGKTSEWFFNTKQEGTKKTA